MFVQVIRGRMSDRAAFDRARERWQRDLKPGATGYLGSTQGVTDDGRFAIVARFESQDAARKNSARPEQGTWWDEVSKAVSDVTFHDCPEVEIVGAGGSDAAGFVQLMVYKPSDVAALRKLTGEFESIMPMRPDIIGGMMAIATDGTVIDTNYFTSESDARAAESQEMTPEVRGLMERFGKLAGDIEFVDLKTPSLDSA